MSFGSIAGGILGGAGGFLLGGPIGAAAGFSIGAGVGGAFDQADANSANAQQAVAQMQFQKMMSDTAHQREVSDLRAAGLNPMLSANAGASTPSGAMATMQSTGTPVQQGLSNAVDAVIRGKTAEATIAQQAANTALINKQSEIAAANAQAAKEQAAQAALQTRRMNAGQDAAEKWAPYEPMINNGAKIIGGVSNAVEAGSAMGAAVKYLRKPSVPPYTILKDGTPMWNQTGEVPIGNPPTR